MFRPAIIFLFVAYFSTNLFSQSFALKNYDVEDGLSNSVVYRVFQDSKGYIWLSTDYGLSRFDGTEFKTYTTKEGLSSNSVFSLAEDASGDIWICCYTGGLCKMHNGIISKVNIKADKLEPLYLTLDKNKKRMWAYNGGNGTAGYVDLNTNKFVQLKDPKQIEGTCSIYISRDGKTYIGTGLGLYLFENNSMKPLWVEKEVNHPVKFIDQDANGNFWVVGKNIMRFSPDFSKMETMSELDLSKSNYCHLKFFAPDQIWFNLADSLFIINATNFKIERRIKLPSIITSAFRDSENNTWFTSYGKGAFRMYNEEVLNYTSGDGLIGNIINGISEDDDGQIWLTTDKGIDCLNNTKLTNYFKYEGVSLIRAGISVHEKTVIIAEYNSLNILTNKNNSGKIKIGSRIYSLYRDKTGKTWVTTQYGTGYLQNNSFFKPEALNALNNKKVFCALMDPKNTMWFGTDSGIYSFDEKNLRRFTTADGLSNDVINSIALGASGEIWAATDMGISCYKDAHWSTYKELASITDKKCTSVLTDKKNNLWVGTYSGLYTLFNNQQLVFEHKNGIAGNEIKCLFLDSKDQLYIGTTKGLSRIDLNKEHFKTNALPPPIYITNVHVNSKPIDVSSALELPWQENTIRIDFKAISFGNSSDIVYQYRLAGMDTIWTNTTNNSIEFSSIASGNYTFQVRAKTPGSVFNNTPAGFYFKIEKPFWKKPFMIVLIVLGSMGGAFVIFYLLLRSFKRKEKQKFELQKKMITLEHRAMSALMNPHFIFNVLNSIQYYLKHVNAEMAHVYLKKFTKLIRLNFDNVQKNFNSLHNECSALELYLALENMRFDNKLTYNIAIAPELDVNNLMIPSMIIQPFVENAIWHGIMPKQSNGHVEITLVKDKDQIIISVEDDGVGIQSENSKIKDHNSSAIKMVRERLSILSRLSGHTTSVKVINLKDLSEKSGTRVEITLPILTNVETEQIASEQLM